VVFILATSAIARHTTYLYMLPPLARAPPILELKWTRTMAPSKNMLCSCTPRLTVHNKLPWQRGGESKLKDEVLNEGGVWCEVGVVGAWRCSGPLVLWS